MELFPLVKAVVSGAVDATAVVDLDLRLVYFNRMYAELAGMRERELRATSPRGMCHERLGLETCAKGDCIAKRAILRRKAIRVDEVRGKHDARLIVTAIPLCLESDEVYAVLETYRDVTAESRMQASYRDLLELGRRRAELLEEEVKRRTLQLERSLVQLTETRSQLVQSEKMSSLGQLVAGIAHELNNPINFIYGNVHFLEEYVGALVSLVERLRELPPETRERRVIEKMIEEANLEFIRTDLKKLMPAIRKGTERAAEIIKGLRRFSYSGTGELRECALNDEIEMALELLALHAKGRVTFVRELGPLPLVRCQSTQIGQVVTNLVVNAIDSIANEGTVTIRTRRGSEETVLIEVEDDGCGIPPEAITKIFEPFFSTKEVGRGTGLGLSISYGIVQAHGGSLQAESKVGKGSRFRVVLPLDPAKPVSPSGRPSTPY